MSTSKEIILKQHAVGLLDYVIYGDNTLTELVNHANESTSIQVSDSRIMKALRGLESTLRKASPRDVCSDCEQEHGELISDVDSELSDVVYYYPDVTEKFSQLENEVHALRLVLADLIDFAAKTVSDEDINDFSEKLLMNTLSGNE